MHDSTHETITAGDDRLHMTVLRESDSILLTLKDLETRRTWGPSLLLALEIYDRTMQRVQRLESYRVDAVDAVEDGVHVTVGDSYRKVSVGLWARIRDGELEVLLPPSEVYERDTRRCRTFAVDVLPDLLTVGPRGVLVLPVGGGALCRPGGKPKLSDRFLIYLEQRRWEICSMLPLAAAHDEDGGLALLAIEGDCDTECRVATDGKGNGKAGFAATLRRHWPDPVDFGHRRYLYSPISPEDDPAHATAKRLRRHVVQALGKPTIKQRAAESPEVAYMLKAISLKAWHGMENEGAEMARRDKSNPITYQSAMTFDETKGQLQRLMDAGIDRMHIYVNGYQPRGHDGLYPTRFPIDERPGGEAKFRDLIRFGKQLGCQMSVHDDFMMNVPHSPDYDPEVIIQDVYGEPLPGGWWGGGVEYQTWGLALPREKLEGHLERMRDLGLNGLYYCDYMIRPLEVNYHPKWRGGRGACARGQVRIVEAARRMFGAVGIEFGSFPGAIAADWVLATSGRPLQPGWPLAELVDERVPMWSLVFQGLVIIGHCGPDWSSTMRAVLMGQHLGCGFSVRDVKGGVLTEERLAALAAAYQIAVKRFGYLQQEELISHKKPADKVSRSVFADGTTVVADHDAGRLEVNGEEVARPEALR